MSEMVETQVLFRVDDELLSALDQIVAERGFKTRNEWFRAQIREAIEAEARRRRVLESLDRLTVEGIEEEDIVRMVKEWRARKRGR
jgi:metal-responsive CopG/Arc/MetJ family transcriptional regulator